LLDGATSATIPTVQGIYRLRCAGLEGLAYIGISLNLRSRLGGLRRVWVPKTRNAGDS